ncbi:hypothetical protein [Tengunoibacter tsumagoiensis]|uniref:hypothetical protein n=1 Tax=Tengunoibacter tsumagoiensis TaxID=2014871 RepID=UPI000F819FC0|nr:hypothetical protein [Tengunoibacter tsumagoiensis]
MGKRFILSRYRLDEMSSRGRSHRLNEADFKPHRLRPYGYDTGSFSYQQMFQVHQSRSGNVADKRASKKAARQQFQKQLRQERMTDERL